MSYQIKTSQARWLVICLGSVFILACASTMTAPATRVVEVTQVVPVTHVIQSTKIIPVTQIVQSTKVVSVTQIVSSTRVIDVIRVITVTQMVEISPTPPNPKDGIYFSAGDSLYHMNLDGSNLKIVTRMMASTVEGMVVNHNTLYFSTFDDKEIYAIDLLSICKKITCEFVSAICFEVGHNSRLALVHFIQLGRNAQCAPGGV